MITLESLVDAGYEAVVDAGFDVGDYYREADAKAFIRTAFEAQLPAYIAAIEAITALVEQAERKGDESGPPLTVTAIRRALAVLAVPSTPNKEQRRYSQCDSTCTVDCGHCKGAGPPSVPSSEGEPT